MDNNFTSVNVGAAEDTASPMNPQLLSGREWLEMQRKEWEEFKIAAAERQKRREEERREAAEERKEQRRIEKIRIRAERKRKGGKAAIGGER